MSTRSAQFIRERSRKIFQTNYVPDFSPRELLSAAAGAISALTNRETGQKIWKIEKPLPLDGRPQALQVYAVARYPVASIGGTVVLTLGAIPDEDIYVQFMAVVEDSMGWDIPMAEQIADVALVNIERGMTARYPQHGGWAMTGGSWRFGHRFAAPEGIPPDPPFAAPAGKQADQPPDFYHNPRTARVWGANFPPAPPQNLVRVAAHALTNRDIGWNLEFFEEMVDGAAVAGVNGHLILPAGSVLYINAFSQYQGNALLLRVAFADSGYWSSRSIEDAMYRAVTAINAALQPQFGVGLTLLQPPRS